MPITRTPLIDDDGTGTTGTIINNAWKQEFYNQIDAAIGAEASWAGVPYNSGTFVGGTGGTWTVTAGQLQYSQIMKIGRTYWWTFSINASTVAGAPSALWLVRPWPEPISIVPPHAIAWLLTASGAVPAFAQKHDANIIAVYQTSTAAIPAGSLTISATVMATF